MPCERVMVRNMMHRDAEEGMAPLIQKRPPDLEGRLSCFHNADARDARGRRCCGLAAILRRASGFAPLMSTVWTLRSSI